MSVADNDVPCLLTQLGFVKLPQMQHN